MSLSDRDYARATPASQPQRSRSGVGRMRVLSVNTWIIIINVLVFLIGHFALVRYDPQRRALEPITQRVSAGTIYFENATEAEIRLGKTDHSLYMPIPKMPGYFGFPIGVPSIDPVSHKQIMNLQGQPTAKHIGWERYSESPVLDAVGHFSTGKIIPELQVWRFITFQFLHFDASHLIFNMLGLWFVGGLVEEYLGRKRYLAFYLVCGLFGAVSYMFLNLLGFIVFNYISPGVRDHVPGLLFDDIYTPLIGASAGVFGVLMASAFIAPRAIVYVLFILPMQLWMAVYLFLAIAVFNLVFGGHNAGGDAAHVGGAIAGAFFIRHAHLLRDFFDLFGDSRKTRSAASDSSSRVNQILDKVHASGLESLTPTERDILRRASAATRER